MVERPSNSAQGAVDVYKRQLHQKIDEGSLCEGSIPDMLRDIAILLQGIKESLADMLLITFLHQLSTLFFSITQYIQLTQQYGKEILHMLCKPMIYNLSLIHI